MVALDRRIPHLFGSEYVIIGQSDTNLTYRYRLPCMDRNRGSGNSAGRNILFPRAGHFLEDVFHIDTHSIDCRFESIIMNKTDDKKTQQSMKKIIIIDGGPRRNMNTARMLQKFADGARSAGEHMDVKTIRLYDLDYKGCMSCMACKLKDRASNVCRFRDALTPVLEDIATADGLVLGSPIYFGDVTGQMRAFLERLSFPWLSYNDYSMTAPRQMPVVLIETMNGTPEKNNSNGFGSMEFCISRALGQPQHIAAYNTCQVNDYSRYELAGFSEEAKHQWREAHWEEDLQKAFDAGRQMAEM